MATYLGHRLPSFLTDGKALVTFGPKRPDSTTEPTAKSESALADLEPIDVTSADLVQLAVDSAMHRKSS